MKTLIIKAHPSSRGFTHKIAERYKQGAMEVGKEVEILDLYKDFVQDFLEFEDVKKIPASKLRIDMQKKITQSDELVFIFPLWWMGAPAILKNFIDQNFTSGFAYRFKKSFIKGMSEGLLKGKIARVFVTCDGSQWFYKIFLTPFKVNWKYFILRFCGIRVKSFVIFDRMHWLKDEQKQKRLNKVYKLAIKI